MDKPIKPRPNRASAIEQKARKAAESGQYTLAAELMSAAMVARRIAAAEIRAAAFARREGWAL